MAKNTKIAGSFFNLYCNSLDNANNLKAEAIYNHYEEDEEFVIYSYETKNNTPSLIKEYLPYTENQTTSKKSDIVESGYYPRSIKLTWEAIKTIEYSAELQLLFDYFVKYIYENLRINNQISNIVTIPHSSEVDSEIIGERSEFNKLIDAYLIKAVNFNGLKLNLFENLTANMNDDDLVISEDDYAFTFSDDFLENVTKEYITDVSANNGGNINSDVYNFYKENLEESKKIYFFKEDDIFGKANTEYKIPYVSELDKIFAKKQKTTPICIGYLIIKTGNYKSNTIKDVFIIPNNYAKSFNDIGVAYKKKYYYLFSPIYVFFDKIDESAEIINYKQKDAQKISGEINRDSRDNSLLDPFKENGKKKAQRRIIKANGKYSIAVKIDGEPGDIMTNFMEKFQFKKTVYLMRKTIFCKLFHSSPKLINKDYVSIIDKIPPANPENVDFIYDRIKENLFLTIYQNNYSKIVDFQKSFVNTQKNIDDNDLRNTKLYINQGDISQYIILKRINNKLGLYKDEWQIIRVKERFYVDKDIDLAILMNYGYVYAAIAQDIHDNFSPMSSHFLVKGKARQNSIYIDVEQIYDSGLDLDTYSSKVLGDFRKKYVKLFGETKVVEASVTPNNSLIMRTNSLSKYYYIYSIKTGEIIRKEIIFKKLIK